MRLPSRCYSSSAIDKDCCWSNENSRPAKAGGSVTVTVTKTNDDSSLSNSKTARTNNTNGIFSLLQKIGVVNKNYLIESTYSLCSPQSTTSGNRWESVESVLSSTTAHSFAFIPSPRQLPLSCSWNSASAAAAADDDVYAATGASADADVNAREKYENRYRPRSWAATNEKKLHTTRQTVDDGIAWSTSDRRRLDAIASTPVNCCEKRKRCHKPGKRKAPQPPQRALVVDDSIFATTPRRRKRKAPAPPTAMATVESERQPLPYDDDGSVTAAATAAAAAVVVYNDSLKLEKGVLKANKNTIEIKTANATVESATSGASAPPVSPKPWYKRSTNTVKATVTATATLNKKATKCRDKPNSCRRYYVDDWMTECGLARTKRVNESNFNKRVSQISVLTNISELDRQACEIIDRERRKQRDVYDSAQAKFYSDSQPTNSENDDCRYRYRYRYQSPPTHAPNTKRGKSDLISILSGITNVTKIVAINSSFSSTKPADIDNCAAKQPRRATKSFFHRVKSTDGGRQNVEKSNDNENGSTTTTTTTTTTKQPSAQSMDVQKIIGEPTVQPEAAAMTSEKSAASPTSINNEESTAVARLKNPAKQGACQTTSTSIRAGPVKPFSSWACPQCTLENPSWKFICEMCNKWRPYSVNRVQVVAVKPKEDGATSNTAKDVAVAAATTSASSPYSTYSRYVDNHSTHVRTGGSGDGKNANEAIITDGGDLEKIRRARLQFFVKNDCANDLNNSRYYSDRDRVKLRNILKELKDSLPSASATNSDYRRRQFTSKITQLSNDIGGSTSNHALSTASLTVDETSRDFNAEKQASISPQFNAFLNFNSSDGSRTRVTTDDESERVTFIGIDDGLAIGSNSTMSTRITSPDEDGTKRQRDLIANEENIVSSSCSSPRATTRPEVVHSNTNNHPNCENLKEYKKVTALAINRLLKKLQTAIGNGQHHEAANIARELARLKVDCRMTPRYSSDGVGALSSPAYENFAPTFVISLFIKEGSECRGPIPLPIDCTMTLRQLKMKIFEEFKIPANRQRWMFENAILNDDNKILEAIGIGRTATPLYLNLIPADSAEIFLFPDVIASQNPVEMEMEMEIEHGRERERENKSTSIVSRYSKNESATTDAKCSFTVVDVDQKYNNSSTSVKKSTVEDEYDGDDEGKLKNLIHTRVTPIPQTDDNATTTILANETEIRVADTLNVWKCDLCTLINEIETKFCSICGQQRRNTSDSRDNNSNLSPENDGNQSKEKEPLSQPRDDDKKLNYQELIDLEKTDLIANAERFECRVCLAEYDQGAGVVLKDCLHTFCKDCLKQTVQFSTEAEVKCPFSDGNYSCDSVLQEREIKALVDVDVYEKHLARSMSEAENKIKNAFHCKTVNCRGWCIYEDNVNEFHCPVCKKTNCLTCQVIHMGLNCKQYQEMSKVESGFNNDAYKTKNMLEEMVEKGEAMVCPTCQIILMKKWGCDWLRCSMCKTEICWITRGPRWGPAGKGDTTAGCRCGINGIKCHPRCNYCH